MRLNRYLANGTALSRRAADEAIAAGRVTVNGEAAEQGMDVSPSDVVTLEGRVVRAPLSHTTIMLNKPVGLVVSRQGQGSSTIYDILPPEYHRLNPVGRLDKDSSGLLLLTDDGDLAQELTHPSHQKIKVYEITLDKPLKPLQQQMITDHGIMLDDGPSKFMITRLESRGKSHEPHNEVRLDSKLVTRDSHAYEVSMSQGRNRQIRRTFAALGYTVQTLHRTQFGPYSLNDLPEGKIQPLPQTSK